LAHDLTLDVILYLLVAAELVAADLTVVVTEDCAAAAALEVTLEATLAAEDAAEDAMLAATFCWAFDTTEEAAVAVAADTAL
jgi:hypothetical protein